MNDDEVITAVREQRDKVHSHTSVDEIISRDRTVRARRRIPGAVTALAVVAAAGTVLALGLTGVLGAAPRPQHRHDPDDGLHACQARQRYRDADHQPERAL